MSCSISTESSGKRKNLTASTSKQKATEKVKSYKCLICSKSYVQQSGLSKHTIMAHTTERPHKCTVCGWTSKTLDYLKQHQSRHVGEKKYSCWKCPSKFSCRVDRTKHFNQAHDNLWPCKTCKRVFSSISKLDRHKQTHSNLKQFVCVICEHSSRTLPNLMSHISSQHTREKPYPCAECPAEYATSSSLKGHVKTAHKRDEWVKNTCSVCEKMCPTKATLRRHMQTHTGEKPHNCLLCGKKFATKGELNRHMQFHIGEKPFECTVCGSRFVTKSMRNQHVKIHNKTFSCNICSKMYPSAFFLKQHLKQHTGEKKFKCEECPNSYFQRGQLNNHVRQAHKKIRPFPCSFCDKSFYRPGMRDKHMTATHLNEKPYKCTICDKRLKGGLTTHIKQHNQLTDLSCAACPKRFLNRTDLLEHHLKIHVGGNYDLLTCVFCNKKFYKIQPLENHMNRHTLERPYFCIDCDGDFFTERHLKYHLRTQHAQR